MTQKVKFLSDRKDFEKLQQVISNVENNGR